MYDPKMSRFQRTVLLATSLLLVVPGAARADLTAFLGSSFSGTPEGTSGADSHTSLTRGLSVGAGLIIVGFEFEWAKANGDDGDGACGRGPLVACEPSLTTWMGNVLLQTPRGLGPVQLYGTIGAGAFREEFEVLDESTTDVGTNVGGGVKVALVGPLRVRVDYRVFKLRGDARYTTPQRLYVGANLAF
jgi:hypothetical protein